MTTTLLATDEGDKGWCMRCHKHIVISNPNLHQSPTGRYYIRGRCPTCNAKTTRLAKKPQGGFNVEPK